MAWTNAATVFNNTFQGQQLFANGAVLTILLIVVTLLLITRNLGAWKKLALPVSLLYVSIFKTTYDNWGTLILLTTGIIFISTAIVPNFPKYLGAQVREGFQQLSGISRDKQLYELKGMEKAMKAPKTLGEIAAEAKQAGGGYAYREAQADKKLKMKFAKELLHSKGKKSAWEHHHLTQMQKARIDNKWLTEKKTKKNQIANPKETALSLSRFNDWYSIFPEDANKKAAKKINKYLTKKKKLKQKELSK